MNMENRAIGQAEETEVIMTGESAIEGYKKLMKMAENARDITTNFDRITDSPEALAKFLGTWFVLPCKLCEHFRNDKCTEKISKRHCDDAEAFEKWLNEESEE